MFKMTKVDLCVWRTHTQKERRGEKGGGEGGMAALTLNVFQKTYGKEVKLPTQRLEHNIQMSFFLIFIAFEEEL